MAERTTSAEESGKEGYFKERALFPIKDSTVGEVKVISEPDVEWL